MSSTSVGRSRVGAWVGGVDGAWKCIPTPDFFIGGGGASGPEYLRVVEAYYRSVQCVGGVGSGCLHAVRAHSGLGCDVSGGSECCDVEARFGCGGIRGVSGSGQSDGHDATFVGSARAGGSGDAVDVHIAADVSATVSVEHELGRVEGACGLPRGPNYLRNKLNRDAKKMRKQRRKSLGFDWRSREVRGAVVDKKVETEKPVVSTGFWNSCQEDTRRQLIESKARMHVAENLRKAKEAEQRIADLDSPYNTMVKAVKMIEFAQKQAEKQNDSRVYGWAKTVATSSAESLARSTPSSVPSFDELEAKLDASSQSSFDLTLKSKDDELERFRNALVRKDEEKNVLMRKLALYEERETKEMDEAERVFKSGTLMTDPTLSSFPGLLTRKPRFGNYDKWNSKHVQLTNADFRSDRMRC